MIFDFDPKKIPKPGDMRYLECRTVDGPALAFRVLLGENEPDVTGGHGGWEAIPRPKRTAISDYKGTPLYEVKIEVLFDGFDIDQSVEGDLRVLSAMGGKDETLGRPPVVTYRGGVPGAGRLWVVNDLLRGPGLRRISDGQIVRQSMTIVFLEFRPPVVAEWESSGPANDAQARHSLEEAAAARARAQAAGDAAQPSVDDLVTAAAAGAIVASSPESVVAAIVRGLLPKILGGSGGVTGNTHSNGDTNVGDVGFGHGGGVSSPVVPTYTVRAGDTLATIAARELGSSTRWQEIADLNGLTDPYDAQFGMVLRMPNR